jgi:hypothetical protein
VKAIVTTFLFDATNKKTMSAFEKVNLNASELGRERGEHSPAFKLTFPNSRKLLNNK